MTVNAEILQNNLLNAFKYFVKWPSNILLKYLKFLLSIKNV